MRGIFSSSYVPANFIIEFEVMKQNVFHKIFLLTYSMVQSPPWDVNWFAASQEIPRISRNLKVHYRTHKRPPPVPILGQPNPVHIPTSHLLEIHPNIIHPSTPRSPQWCPSLRYPHQDPIHPLSSPIRATCPAHHKNFLVVRFKNCTAFTLIKFLPLNNFVEYSLVEKLIRA